MSRDESPLSSFDGSIAVLSPHFDDAALSLGASLVKRKARGYRTTVVTALGGDPASAAPAGPWDSTCGFSTAGEAARLRRLEDVEACDILGATPTWLSYGDEQYPKGGTAEEIVGDLASITRGHDAVVLPGFPLVHADHAWLTTAVLAHSDRFPALWLYVEQPYAANEVLAWGYSPAALLGLLRPRLGPPGARRIARADELARAPAVPGTTLDWHVEGYTREEWTLKQRSITAYASQLDTLGRDLLRRIRAYERDSGGEQVAVPSVSRA